MVPLSWTCKVHREFRLKIYLNEMFRPSGGVFIPQRAQKLKIGSDVFEMYFGGDLR